MIPVLRIIFPGSQILPDPHHRSGGRVSQCPVRWRRVRKPGDEKLGARGGKRWNYDRETPWFFGETRYIQVL